MLFLCLRVIPSDMALVLVEAESDLRSPGITPKTTFAELLQSRSSVANMLKFAGLQSDLLPRIAARDNKVRRIAGTSPCAIWSPRTVSALA